MSWGNLNKRLSAAGSKPFWIISKLVGRSDPPPCCPGKKAGAEAKKGREKPFKFPLFVSARRRGGKGIAG
jgi:hypothetical protein